MSIFGPKISRVVNAEKRYPGNGKLTIAYVLLLRLHDKTCLRTESAPLKWCNIVLFAMQMIAGNAAVWNVCRVRQLFFLKIAFYPAFAGDSFRGSLNPFCFKKISIQPLVSMIAKQIDVLSGICSGCHRCSYQWSKINLLEYRDIQHICLSVTLDSNKKYNR